MYGRRDFVKNYRVASVQWTKAPFRASASTAWEKVSTAGTNLADENLFRLVPVLGHGARVLPLELVAVPGDGAQISAREPTKGYVQNWSLDGALLNYPYLTEPVSRLTCLGFRVSILAVEPWFAIRRSRQNLM